MENVIETDMSKYRHEARIYSADGKFEHIFNDMVFLEKINQCVHPTALSNINKAAISEVEAILAPLIAKATSLIIEIKGGSVVAEMALEDFFKLIELGKRVTINDRFQVKIPLPEDRVKMISQEIQDFLGKLEAK